MLLSVLLAAAAVAAPAQAAVAQQPSEAAPDLLASRFATLALACVHREYPNKIAHVLNARRRRPAAARADPRLLRLLRLALVGARPLAARAARARFRPRRRCAEDARGRSPAASRAENVAAEVAYLEGKGRVSFERPYGLAWLLQLAAELREWTTPEAQAWAAALAPLEQRRGGPRSREWLPKLTQPDPRRRALADRVRVRPRARLGAHGRSRRTRSCWPWRAQP